MALIPQYRFELYKKLSDDSFSVVPTLINGFSNMDYKGGIETTKDVLDIKFPNLRINGSAFATFMGKANRYDNFLAVDDDVKFYAYYGLTPPTNIDDALIISGRTSSLSHAPNADGYVYSVKVVNRTEELLNTMVPYSSRANSGAANTCPTAIVQMISRLNKHNSLKKIYAGLDNALLSVDGIAITGSYGHVASTKSDGTAFPTIEFNVDYKPVYYNIEKLSSSDYTGDENMSMYVYYVKYTAILPQYWNTYGKYINELVWKPKSLTVSGSLQEGITINNVNISLDIRDIQNVLVFNAGTDRKGNGITGVATDLTSVARYGAKFGYYTASRRVFSDLATQESNYVQTTLGKVIDSDGMPAAGTGSYPITMQFKARDVNGAFTGGYLVANSKTDWNQYLRNEAKWQAQLQATKVIERLSTPRYDLTADLPIGSNNIVPGGIMDFIVPSYGWEGTTANPSFKLRITDMQHSFNNSGWTSKLVAKEDEKILSDFLKNVRTNV